MKKIFSILMVAAVSLIFLFPGESFGVKFKGKYKGKGVAKVRGCNDRDDNGNYKFNSMIKITKQTGKLVTGKAYNRLRVGSYRIKEICALSGTAKGKYVRGNTFCDMYVNGRWDSSSQGKFKAKKKGKKLYVTSKDRDTAGDSCRTRIKAKLKK